MKYSLKNTKKIKCPNLNCPSHRQGIKSFKQYTDENGQPLAEYVGRCDKANKCGYNYTPKDYFNDNKGVKREYAPRVQQYVPKKKTSYHPSEWASVGVEHSNLLKFLGNDYEQKFCEYKIGGTKTGGTIFWQIDASQNIRAGKIMYYNQHGKRTSKFNWVHKLKCKDFNLKQCFFGEHLIKDFNGENICIVESEKTAVIMSYFFPAHLWLACGSMWGLGSPKLPEKIRTKAFECLKKGKNIVLFPDTGAAEDVWIDIANVMGFDIIKLSDLLPKIQLGIGDDVADYVLNKRCEIEINKNLNKLMI